MVGFLPGLCKTLGFIIHDREVEEEEDIVGSGLLEVDSQERLYINRVLWSWWLGAMAFMSLYFAYIYSYYLLLSPAQNSK